MSNESAQVAATAATATAEAVKPPTPGSPEYNAAMIAKARGSRIIENGVERTVNPENPVVDATATSTTDAAAAAVAAAQPVVADGGILPKPVVATVAVVKAPDGTPAKFVNADGSLNQTALLKSYAEAERVITTRQAAAAKTPEQVAAEAAAQAAKTPEQIAAEAAATAAAAVKTPEQIAAETAAATPPVTFVQAQEAATAELAKDGKLSDASYATFEKLGIPKQAVDVYVQGQVAQANVYLGEIHTAGGGKDAYTSMVKWAGANLSAAEAAAYDGAVRSGDRGQMQMAVAGLKARYVASNGTGGTLLTPAPGTVQAATAAFASQDEMTQAMRDPRYAKDSAYRAEVAAKVAASKRQGISLGINAYANRQ